MEECYAIDGRLIIGRASPHFSMIDIESQRVVKTIDVRDTDAQAASICFVRACVGCKRGTHCSRPCQWCHLYLKYANV